MARPALLATLLALAAAPAAAGERPRVVVVPFENVPRAGEVRDVVMPTVELALAGKGWEVVGRDAIEEFLHARRIRYLDSLTPAQAIELRRATGADATLVGAVLAYGARGVEPRVALTATLLGGDGEVLWSNVTGLTASETEGVFGLGKATRVDEVARRAVRQLLDPLPRGRLSPVRVRHAGGGTPRVYRARELRGKAITVCVLPLENLSEDRDAPRIVDAVLQHRLSERVSVTAVAPADLRAGIVGARARAPSQMSPEQLRAVGKRVGTSLFLRGTILTYGASSEEGANAPEIELYLTLVDVESGRILWSGLHRRTGAHYEGLLRRGAIHDYTTLANRVVGELIDAFTD